MTMPKRSGGRPKPAKDGTRRGAAPVLPWEAVAGRSVWLSVTALSRKNGTMSLPYTLHIDGKNRAVWFVDITDTQGVYPKGGTNLSRFNQSGRITTTAVAALVALATGYPMREEWLVAARDARASVLVLKGARCTFKNQTLVTGHKPV